MTIWRQTLIVDGALPPCPLSWDRTPNCVEEREKISLSVAGQGCLFFTSCFSRITLQLAANVGEGYVSVIR